MRFVLPALLMMACNPSGTGANFESGDFDFQTTDVADGCLDGAFDTLFMPEGTANDFGTPIYVPALDELPASYDVDLADPFGSMPVEVTGDDETREIRGAQTTDVEYDSDNNPGCLIDALIDVDLTIDDADTVHGTATLELGSFDESTCPVVTNTSGCDVVLSLSGTRR
jgi:hypothetical protein